VLGVFLLSLGIDEYVVYEDRDKLIEEWPEDPVHVVYKYNWSNSRRKQTTKKGKEKRRVEFNLHEGNAQLTWRERGSLKP